MAQLGVHLLLFTLGLEFSLTKLRAVRNVALLGGLLQVRVGVRDMRVLADGCWEARAALAWT